MNPSACETCAARSLPGRKNKVLHGTVRIRRRGLLLSIEQRQRGKTFFRTTPRNGNELEVPRPVCRLSTEARKTSASSTFLHKLCTYTLSVRVTTTQLGHRRQFQLVVQVIRLGRSSVAWSSHVCVAGEGLRAGVGVGARRRLAEVSPRNFCHHICRGRVLPILALPSARLLSNAKVCKTYRVTVRSIKSVHEKLRREFAYLHYILR